MHIFITSIIKTHFISNKISIFLPLVLKNLEHQARQPYFFKSFKYICCHKNAPRAQKEAKLIAARSFTISSNLKNIIRFTPNNRNYKAIVDINNMESINHLVVNNLLLNQNLSLTNSTLKKLLKVFIIKIFTFNKFILKKIFKKLN